MVLPAATLLRPSWATSLHLPGPVVRDAEELTTTGKAIVGQVKRLADASDAARQNAGGGTPTKTAGASFNPFTASVGALGGETLRVTFPKGASTSTAVKLLTEQLWNKFLDRVSLTTLPPPRGREWGEANGTHLPSRPFHQTNKRFSAGAELIADRSVKMYQCKFTYLKDKKLDATKTKTSEATFADTERTFACVVPAWGEKGKMPEEPNFTTDFEVLENGRTMPAPSGGQVRASASNPPLHTHTHTRSRFFWSCDASSWERAAREAADTCLACGHVWLYVPTRSSSGHRRSPPSNLAASRTPSAALRARRRSFRSTSLSCEAEAMHTHMYTHTPNYACAHGTRHTCTLTCARSHVHTHLHASSRKHTHVHARTRVHMTVTPRTHV